MSTDAPLDHSGLRVMSTSECLAHLASTAIGRVGFTHDGEVLILPVHHVVHEGVVHFRTSGGSKIEVAAGHGPIGFEVDDYDQSAGSGWSVALTGVASVVDDDAVLAELERAHGHVWVVGDASAQAWVRIQPNSITGRELRPG